MKKLYWVFLVLVAVVGLGVSIYFGLQPKPVGKINYSTFKSAEYFGEALLQRLNNEFKAAPVVFFGVLPDEKFHAEVWAAFFKINQASETRFDYVIVDKNLPFKDLIGVTEQIDLSGGKQIFLDGLKKILSENKRVAFVLPTLAVTRQTEFSVTSQIQADLDYPGFSLSTSVFPRNSSEEDKMPIKCGNDNTNSNTSRLGCFIQQQARVTYRKKNPENKIEGSVSQVGTKEYLVLLNNAK